MQRSWRLLVLAAMLNVCLGAGVAAWQTVIVRKAPPGTRVEVAVNAATVASADVDPAGDAKVPINLTAAAGKPEIDANVFVDFCDTVRRVVIVERDRLPLPPEAGCTRRQISGVFWVRRVNTLVVDVGGANPTMLLIKGSYGLGPEAAPRTWTPSLAGLVLSGGGGFVSFRDARALACGNVTPCGGHDSGLAYTGAITYWFNRFLGAEGSYMKPGKVTANGSGGTFSFDSSLDARMVTIAGKVGVPAGPVKLYGLVGTNYHQATSSTAQTIDSATQTLEFKTEGWGLLFGGGADAWIAPRVALYAEAGLAGLKGKAVGGGEAQIDDRVRVILIGVRVRVSR
jgi:outer membrane protein with beta-barrel domain